MTRGCRDLPGFRPGTGGAEPVRSRRHRPVVRPLAALLLCGAFWGPAGAALPPWQAAPPAGNAAAAGDALGERAFTHLKAQCAFGPRNPGSSGHARCGEYIREVLVRAGGAVSTQTFSHKAPALPEPVELTNILARFGPQRAGGILLGAHWDTRPWAERDPDPARRDEPILGANDGASGTGLLLALAESFRAEPPQIPVLLVFFDGEDLGREGYSGEYLAGSRHFAANLPELIPEMAVIVDLVASSSMVLTLDLTTRTFFPEWGTLIDGLARRLDLTAYDGNWGPELIDDHIPLLEVGLPAICLIDFRDPFWHTHKDRPENCSAVNLGQTGRLVHALITGGFLR